MSPYSYPSTIEGWKNWLEQTRDADVGKDSMIDKGYQHLTVGSAYAHITPFLLETLFSIATDPKVRAYQIYTATILIGNVTTKSGIETLDRLLEYVIQLGLTDVEEAKKIWLEPIAMAFEQQQDMSQNRMNLIKQILDQDHYCIEDKERLSEVKQPFL